jgi:S-DNA-T family DNA segregation ATPase FtsK/SpoIIIE
MAKKKSVKKKPAAVKSKSAPKHSLPGGFWQQVVALLAMVFAGILILAMLGIGGSLPAETLKAFRSIIGLVTFFVPAVIIYLAIKKIFADGNVLALGVHFGFFAFILSCSGMIATLFREGTKVENSGGELGKILAESMLNFMNPIAGFFIFFALTLVSLMFIFKVQPKKLVELIAQALKPKEHTRVFERASADSANSEGISAVDEFKPTKIKLNRGVDVVDDQDREMELAASLRASQNNEEEKVEHKAGLKERLSSIKESLTTNETVSTVVDAGGEKAALTSTEDSEWKFPATSLLDNKIVKADAGDITKNARIIQETLRDFKINVEMEEANVGPRVTQYTLKPPAGVKLSKITGLDTNLALNLAAGSIRIEAPIPGKSAVGVEVPNKKQATVTMRSILESKEWQADKEPLSFAIGKDIAGQASLGELGSMPHMLVAGQTGSGKSVVINNLIVSLLYRCTPSELKLILVDPKRVEFAPYNGIPHLLTPVIVEPEKTLSALKWAVNEMERRYSLLAEYGHRNVKGYNADKTIEEKMPFIVIIIDELADLMMLAAKDVEGLIVRIAQKARAVGIHLVLATQRPSVDVVTGLIKANIPARIALTVSSQVDSRTILDQVGAEKLLGKGDMLMTTSQHPKPKRIQAAFIDDPEVLKITTEIKMQRPPDYNDEVIAQQVQVGSRGGVVFDGGSAGDGDDELYSQAVNAVLAAGKASSSLLQRRLRIGFSRASRLMEEMEDKGVIGPDVGNKPREVLISGEVNDEGF